MKARTNQWFSILQINGVSLLETELGNRKTNHVMLVYCHAPPRQEMKDCHRPRDAGTAVGPHAMAHVLAMADGGEPRQHRFDQHARVPGATRTDFHVAGIARLRMETCIRQDDHLAVKLGKQRLQRRIMDMGRGTIPGPDQAPLVQDKTQLPPRQSPEDCWSLSCHSALGYALPAWGASAQSRRCPRRHAPWVWPESGRSMPCGS
jgi:hypothetical protein